MEAETQEQSGKHSRSARSHGSWAEILAEFAASGMNQSEFSRVRGLAKGTLSYQLARARNAQWANPETQRAKRLEKQLQKRGQNGHRAPGLLGRPTLRPQNLMDGFIPLGGSNSSGEIKIEFPNGVKVTLPANSAPALIEAVIQGAK